MTPLTFTATIPLLLLMALAYVGFDLPPSLPPPVPFVAQCSFFSVSCLILLLYLLELIRVRRQRSLLFRICENPVVSDIFLCKDDEPSSPSNPLGYSTGEPS